MILSMFVLTVLFGLTACFSLAGVGELNASNRYHDSANAFWTAEAAINRFIQDTSMLDGGDLVLNIGGNTVSLSKDDITDPQFRTVTATSTTADGIQRTLEVQFPAGVASVYNNTVSSGENFGYTGITWPWQTTTLAADGQTQVSDTYSEAGQTDSNITGLQQDVGDGLTTLIYGDEDGNGTGDEFGDFQTYYRELTDTTDPNYTGEYADEEVMYIPTSGTANFSPASDLNGKKVIFVDGGAPGDGNAAIWLDTSWAADQNMTVVATGAVVFIQPLENPVANSSLHTVSWGSYIEGALVQSEHSGTNYTHDQAIVGFAGINENVSTTNGSIIANEGVDVVILGEAGKAYEYVDPVDGDGLVPPGFGGLIGGGGAGFSDTPSSWIEI